MSIAAPHGRTTRVASLVPLVCPSRLLLAVAGVLLPLMAATAGQAQTYHVLHNFAGDSDGAGGSRWQSNQGNNIVA